MRSRSLITFLLPLLAAVKLTAQPQPVTEPDHLFFHGNQSVEFNFSDAFCPNYPCTAPANAQVIVAGAMYGDAYLYWDDGTGNTGRVLIPRANSRDGFRISDMLVAYNGSTPVCYIVGAYHANSDPSFFGRAKILTAYWDGFSFVLSGSAQNITTAPISTWYPKIAQDYQGNLIIAWWQAVAGNGTLMARRYSVSSTSPFYSVASQAINVYNSIAGTAGYNFLDEPDVAIHQPDYNTTTIPVVTFTLQLTNSTTTVIKTYQANYSTLTSGTTTDIVSVNNSQYSLSLPSIATISYSATGYLNDFCIAYSQRDVNTNEIDVVSNTKFNGLLMGARTLNQDYGEQTCGSSGVRVGGGFGGYVVLWSSPDCRFLIPRSGGMSSIFGRYLDYNGSDKTWGYIPYYFFVDLDHTYGKYSPAIGMSSNNGWDNIYASYLYSDAPDIVPVGTVISYFIGYKYLGGYAYRNHASPEPELTGYPKRSLSVFPNPVKDLINIRSAELISSISILDITGRIIYTRQNINSKSVILNSSAFLLVPGTYIIAVMNEKGQKTFFKFLKQ